MESPKVLFLCLICWLVFFVFLILVRVSSILFSKPTRQPKLVIMELLPDTVWSCFMKFYLLFSDLYYFSHMAKITRLFEIYFYCTATLFSGTITVDTSCSYLCSVLYRSAANSFLSICFEFFRMNCSKCPLISYKLVKSFLCSSAIYFSDRFP